MVSDFLTKWFLISDNIVSDSQKHDFDLLGMRFFGTILAITKSLGSQIVSLPCLLYSWRENAVSMIYGHCEMTGNTTNVVS